MSDTTIHVRDFIQIFHYVQHRISNAEISEHFDRDCSKDTREAADLNVYVRRHLLIAASVDYHTKVLTDFTFQYLRDNMPAHWSYTYAAFAYMYMCAFASGTMVGVVPSIPDYVMDYLDHVKENILTENEFGVASTCAGNTSRSGSLDEGAFLVTLNNREISNDNWCDLLREVHTPAYEFSLHSAYVSAKTLNRIRPMLFDMSMYSRKIVTAVYALALHIIEHPEEDPRVLYERYIKGVPYPKYLEEHVWNPRNCVVYRRQGETDAIIY